MLHLNSGNGCFLFCFFSGAHDVSAQLHLTVTAAGRSCGLSGGMADRDKDEWLNEGDGEGAVRG